MDSCKMQVTVTTMTDILFNLEVADDMELENFKALCESECSIELSHMVVMFEGKPLLDDKKDLKSYGVKSGDVVLIQRGQGQVEAGSNMNSDFSSIQVPTGRPGQQPSDEQRENDPVFLRTMLLSNPDQLATLKVNNPRLAEALEKGIEEFAKILREQQNERLEHEKMRRRMILADPFDAEAQALIAQEIVRQNIESNMETAMEYHPDQYGQVTMLYIDCKVNGHPVKAFVDSGAQSTIMSNACAERCNIVRLIDSRWSGIAKGVGTQRIIGRIHLCQVQIEQDFLASSFTILQDQPMDMLLGLDMLKRHQCSIDLKRNVLFISTTGTETRFLTETEMPEFAKNNRSEPVEDMDEDEQLAKAIDRSIVENCKFPL